LRYFIAVAEEGSFTRAAARLAMQQPPLSQQLKALEAELGSPLFRRHARGVEMTPAGAVFLDEARAVISRLDAATLKARRVARGFAGSLTIGLATSAASHPGTPAAIGAFRARYPEVALSFLEGDAAALTAAVHEGEADLALIRAPVARPPELVFHTLAEEPVMAALARSHPRAVQARRRKSKSIALEDLRDESFILVRRAGAPGIYGDLVLACRKAGFEPRIAAEVSNMFINTTLVAAGVGVSIVPYSMRESHAAQVTYLELRSARRMSAPLTLVTRRDNDNPAGAHFRAIASATVAPRSREGK
ncbi:MAG TPA: LysR family transcriptional regulator, partial [Usitatibacter sp.]|nr:LysR family transcriptional regulator [Usitatibacter sp.]